MSFLDLFRSQPRSRLQKEAFRAPQDSIAGTAPGQEGEIQHGRGREASGMTPVTHRKKRDTIGRGANRPSGRGIKARSHRSAGRTARKQVRTGVRKPGKRASGGKNRRARSGAAGRRVR